MFAENFVGMMEQKFTEIDSEMMQWILYWTKILW